MTDRESQPTNMTIGGRPAVRQSEVHYYTAECPTCGFVHVSAEVNMDGRLIRCECGTAFWVTGKELSYGR